MYGFKSHKKSEEIFEKIVFMVAVIPYAITQHSTAVFIVCTCTLCVMRYKVMAREGAKKIVSYLFP